MTPLPISHFTLTSALGAGRSAHATALLAERTGLRKLAVDSNQLDCRLECWLGEIDGFDRPLPHELAEWDCRNNRIAEFALQQDDFLAAARRCVERHGSRRIGVFIGTSTSGVQQTELAYRARDATDNRLPSWFDHRTTQNLYSVADFVALRVGSTGPRFAISTACSSSAKVFAAAYRAIELGICDAAVVGGVDSLCLTTLYGFNSLQLLSNDICRPCDPQRSGISIGEAGGFAVLDPHADAAFRLLGYGETSDAYHMSTPDPEGLGAATAMNAALAGAQLTPTDIDYVNLHGTGTPVNDKAESRAIAAVFGDALPCSSTKGWTGHTLGAAGIVEAGFALLCIEHGLMPRTLNARSKDPELSANILLAARRGPVRRVMSNSFGFGGSNCALLFGATV